MNRDEIQREADILLDYHGLAGQGWKFVFDTNTKRRLGQCRYTEQEVALTGWYVDKNEHMIVYDTLLHEVAHALTQGSGHGAEWRAMCAKLGCRPRACKQNHTFTGRPERYVAACEICGRTYFKEKLNRRKIYWCYCQTHRLREERTTLAWLMNSQRAKDVAEGVLPTPQGEEIQTIIYKLGNTTDRNIAKRLRARLRKLGHKGGLNG